MSDIRRRHFITLLGGAAAWPLAARAQQGLPAIGFLHEKLPAPLSLTTAFQQGLIEAGVSTGSSLRIENRWAEGQYDRLPALGHCPSPSVMEYRHVFLLLLSATS
jgi:hypothetical protein